MADGDRVQQLAKASYDRGDALGWFEDVYREASGDPTWVPWVRSAPNEFLRGWLDANPVPADCSALVVGAGLGDDAELLAARGCSVTAFDISPTAIRWAKSLFPETTVKYCVGDVLNPPSIWIRHFDLVYESCTLQALPFRLRAQAVTQIAALVAPGGTLLVTAFGRDEDEEAKRLPWPLTRTELSAFDAAGMRQTSFVDVTDGTSRRWFVATWTPTESP